MISISVKELADFTGGELVSKNGACAVNSVSIDSRTIKSGDFFVAISGDNFNGHDFLEDVSRRGAQGCGKNLQ